MSGGTVIGRVSTLLRPIESTAAKTGRWIRRRFFSPEYPLIAVEVRALSVGVVRAVREKGRLCLGAATCLDLPEGALRVSMVEPNLVDRRAFLATLRAALERTGSLRAGKIALVLPDPVARATIFSVQELPVRRRSETLQAIRFRLRKSVPFDAREARVVFNILPGGSVLVGAIARAVLDDYEDAFQELGLHVGLIELAGLVLHDNAVRHRLPADRLVVNWDAGYVSVILSRAGAPVLIRTLAGDLSATPSEVAREIASTILYYRERLGGEGLASVAIRRTVGDPGGVDPVISEALGLSPEPLDPWAQLKDGESPPATAQSLAGAVACVSERAA